MAADLAAAQKKVDDLKAANAKAAEVKKAEAAVAALPKTEVAAREAYTAARVTNNSRAGPLGGMPAHAASFPRATEEARSIV